MAVAFIGLRSREMVAGDSISFEVSRLKREDCGRTKHDREFSKWQILIGSCDWEDYSLGKEGAERYRVHNLPKNSGPGVYELGIAVSRTSLGREIGKLDPDRIVVVYLGQADNVRTRLQHYGRSGSHLGNSLSIGASNDCKVVGLHKGPGLFEETLSRGYPIVFRWAAIQSKTEARKTETRLLNTFDYAWNSSTNGPRRPDDVFTRLKKVSSSPSSFSGITRNLMPFVQRQVGIRIKAEKFPSGEGGSSACVDEESNNHLSRIFKFGRSRPRLLVQDRMITENHDEAVVCGVVLGRDSICRRPPVEGRKRCSEHKGMRIKGPVSSSNVCSQSASSEPCSTLGSVKIQPVTGYCSTTSTERYDVVCGFILANGSPCRSRPVRGNKRCLEHKGRRICGPNSTFLLDPISRSGMSEFGFPNRPENSKFGAVCGVLLGDGLLCTRRPTGGRVRCEEHRGMRVRKTYL